MKWVSEISFQQNCYLLRTRSSADKVMSCHCLARELCHDRIFLVWPYLIHLASLLSLHQKNIRKKFNIPSSSVDYG